MAESPLTRARSYLNRSGPGWLQGAVTLGGGTLAGSLYLGVIGGYSFLWLQAFAMGMGVVMLGAITYVTLSTGRRPFEAMREHVNPVLAWGWLAATLVANTVWSFPQFALGTAALLQNLAPWLPRWTGGQGPATALSCALVLAASTAVIGSYEREGRGTRLFEGILKGMVGLIVLCFVGVVVKLTASGGGIAWRAVASGLVPDVRLLVHPVDTFREALDATGPYADYWSRLIVGEQRNIMVTAVAAAVGINMTFLLPYSMLRKSWGRSSRGLALADLVMGLFVPFVLATGCILIASGARFHATPQPGLDDGTAPAGMVAQYRELRRGRLEAEIGAEASAALTSAQLDARLGALPEPDARVAAMLVRRDAFNLAESLETLTGRTFARYVFGIGVFGMAVSTVILLMLISGFAVCEALGRPHSGRAFRWGCLVPGIGALAPFVWTGRTQFWLAVPTSVFNMSFLPIAYLAFFLMMNNRALMGDEMLRGGKRIVANGLMLAALGAATVGAAWSVWNTAGWLGAALVGSFVVAAVVVHLRRDRGPTPERALTRARRRGSRAAR